MSGLLDVFVDQGLVRTEEDGGAGAVATLRGLLTISMIAGFSPAPGLVMCSPTRQPIAVRSVSGSQLIKSWEDKGGETFLSLHCVPSVDLCSLEKGRLLLTGGARRMVQISQPSPS